MPAGLIVLPGPKEGAAAVGTGMVGGTSFGKAWGLLLKFFAIALKIGGFLDGTELNLWKFWYSSFRPELSSLG